MRYLLLLLLLRVTLDAQTLFTAGQGITLVSTSNQYVQNGITGSIFGITISATSPATTQYVYLSVTNVLNVTNNVTTNVVSYTNFVNYTNSVTNFTRLLVDAVGITNNGTVAALATNGVFPNILRWGSAILAGTNIFLDCSTNLTASVTLTNASWITVTNMVEGESVMLLVRQDGVGSRGVTWSNVVWRGNSPPVLTTNANKSDLIGFLNVRGTNYGSYSLNYY
jgi:hypothetical protein